MAQSYAGLPRNSTIAVSGQRAAWSAPIESKGQAAGGEIGLVRYLRPGNRRAPEGDIAVVNGPRHIVAKRGIEYHVAGGRADRSLVRQGADRAVVEALIEIEAVAVVP